eukprot:c25392_g3_i1 orf=2-247(-)
MTPNANRENIQFMTFYRQSCFARAPPLKSIYGLRSGFFHALFPLSRLQYFLHPLACQQPHINLPKGHKLSNHFYLPVLLVQR